MRYPLFLLLLLSACGYHYDGAEKIAISVPYVIGDHEGELTNALIRAISNAPNFRYASNGGDWMLKAKILGSSNDRIGFRYDRGLEENDKKEKVVVRKKNLVGVENRKEISVEVRVVDCCTGKSVIGPQVIKMDVDYDYVNPTDLMDLSFIDPETELRRTSISFSLGQLDSVGAAGEDALYPLYRRLAQRVVDGLIATGGPDGCCPP